MSADDNAPEQAREVGVVAAVMYDELNGADTLSWDNRHPDVQEVWREAAEGVLRALAPLRATERQGAAREALLAAADGLEGLRFNDAPPEALHLQQVHNAAIDLVVMNLRLSDSADGVTGRSGT